jgi:HK97 gp10 family phage protein
MNKQTEIKVDVSGLERLLREEPGKVETWLDSVAESIVTDVKLSFGTSPAGESYTRGGVTHVASQPGYPPNVDIGTLTNTIRQEKTGTLERTVMDGVEYGLYLEDGTEHIEPRPFMRPAFDRARQTVERDAANNLGLEK